MYCVYAPDPSHCYKTSGLSQLILINTNLIFKLAFQNKTGKTGPSREGNTVQPKVIWFGFCSIGN